MPTKTKTECSGKVISFFSGVGIIAGLSGVWLHEILVTAGGGAAAVVIGFDGDVIEALFFDDEFDLAKTVGRSRRLFKVPVSTSYVGRVLNGFGEPLDDLGDVKGAARQVFQPAPSIIDREPVTTPLTTGVKIIDTNLPLGRGQRELIIGDRKLGKSTLAIDTVLNQKYAHRPVVCIYVLIGKEEQQLRDLISTFEESNAFLYSFIVAATGKSSLLEQYLAPFVGCTLAETFRDQGQDALVIYDDLSNHAKTYRTISLLLQRAPGREAYPSDVFSLHAGLLERAAKLSKKNKGGSLTALPIIETQEGDITSFIPTNLISITDGQIYFERGLFQKGFLPAVNVGLSVSRVGSQAQPSYLQKVVGGIRLTLSQHKELQRLSQLETVISRETKSKIERGDLVLNLLKQGKHTYVSAPEQAVLFYAVEQGMIDSVSSKHWPKFEKLLLELMRNRYPEILKRIEKAEFDQQITDEIKKIMEDFKREFIETQKL